MSNFEDLFNSAVSSAHASSPLEIAEYWASRRGKGAPSSDDVAHEQIWERIVDAAARGSP